MTARRRHGGAAGVAFAVFAAACAPGEAPAPHPAAGSPPSVLLVTLDTTRADHLGAYGATTGATPQLDALARRGVVFESAYAVAPMTLPAHSSMFTGLLPNRTGVRWNGEQRLAPGPDGPPTLAERFRAGGYATAAFVSASVLDHAFGLDRGFATYDDAIGDGGGATGDWKAERPARATVARALAWLAAQPADRPVFLWVHLFEPHDPYAPPAPLADRFRDDPYSGEIATADDALAPLLDHPRFRPTAPAVVSVLGDHGESLGEHGEATHGILLQEAVLRVPWIVAAPHLAPRRVVTAVSQVDLMPTLLALAGLETTAGQTEPDGADLARELRGETGDRARTLYAESLYASTLYGWAPLFSARRGEYKLVAGLRSELFDFVADPGEKRDLRNQQPAAAGTLQRALAEIQGRGAPSGGSAAAVDARLAEDLRSLGYLSGGAAGSAAEASVDPRDRIALHESLRELEGAWRRGDRAAAERRLDELFAEDPGNRLLQQVVERQLRGAVAQLAGSDADTTAALRVRLAQLVAASGRRDEARQLLELAADPAAAAATQSLAQTSLATLALGERRFDEAERHARAALALEPGNALAQGTLAVALDDLGRLDEAEAAYRAALVLDPALYANEWNLALLLAGQPARRSEAAEHLRRFLARAPAGDPRLAEARRALERLSAASGGGG